MDEPWRFERIALGNGLGMRVARAGVDPARALVVMLHGFPECWYSWRHQLPVLSSSFECAAPDLRGYGGTDAPAGVANYTIDKLVGDVACLIEALGRKRAVVIGHDWGGAIAWATALMRPEIVERLCVMNCPHPARFRHALTHDPRQMARSWYIAFFQIPWLPERILRARGFALLRRAIRDSAVNRAALSDADLDRYCEALAGPYALTAAINYYRALTRSFAPAGSRGGWISHRIDAPTMLIWGEQDIALRKTLTLRMEPLFGGPFQVRYVPDCGHWVQQESPSVVNRYLLEFLARPPRDSRADFT